MPASAINTEARDKAEAARDLLKLRLLEEGENDLLAKIAKCGRLVYLRCSTCKDEIELSEQCKRKWCPSCSRLSAARRAAELRHIVRHFRWPLFMTLTMRNVFDVSPSDVKKLRRAFGKLRHRKLWRERHDDHGRRIGAGVTAGIATIEVTNEGNGWHIHLHAVIDCEWLAWHVQMPRRGAGKAAWEKACKAAAIELERTWSKILGQETSSVKVKRCDAETISKEVLKYACKSSDLLESPDPIGNMLRALDSTRLMTTFGSAHGQKVREIRAAAKAECDLERAAFKAELPPRCYCGCEEWYPSDMDADRDARRALEEKSAPYLLACIKRDREENRALLKKNSALRA